MKLELVGHQGDLVIFKVDGALEGEKKKPENERGILTYSETSGHCHQFKDMTGVEHFIMGEYALQFAELKNSVAIRHGRDSAFTGIEADYDYHKDVILDPGIYAFGIVEETDWISRTVRRVVD